MPQVQPQHVDTAEGGTYRLRVPRGKDTTGGGGRPRDAYLPAPVERNLQRYQNSANIPPREPFTDLTERGIRAAVKRTGKAAAELTGGGNFRHVSGHDLRRRYTQRLLVMKGRSTTRNPVKKASDTLTGRGKYS